MKWWYCMVAGIGDCVLRTDVDLHNQFEGDDFFEFHNLTVILVNPQNGQTGYMKHMSSNPNMCNGGSIMRRSAIQICTEAREPIIKDMDRVWSDSPSGGIALPTTEDVLKFRNKK